MIGKIISHYKILAKLGEGGMGVVYKAEDTRLKRLVALKFLPSSIMASEAEKTRFVHEAQAAALNHPNICTIHEIDEADGQSFIAMEFVEGQSLKEKIASGMLQVASVIDFAIQIAEGLQAAHEKKITHRDIKPANIMITSKGQAKIMDFGLAKLAGRTLLTKEGTTLGTVAYMSPEQARGEEVDHRTDIWALGVVLYETITGQLPFKGEYEQAVMYSLLNENPEPLTGLRTGVPMELERIVNKAMSKKPEERYQHVDELLVDLRSIEKNIASGASKRQATAAKLQRQTPIYLYGGVAALLALLIGTGLYFKLQTGTPQAKYDSIAVLPLDNLSGDPEQEYFADGMTEALITDLAQISALKVISRTSVMQYKGAKKPLPEIAKELNVDAVVEGSVQRFGDRVKITAQLIEAVTDRHLWAKSYERELRDILALQNEVARAVADEIKVKLTPQEQARLTSTRQVNPEAHEAYLKGRYYWNKRTEEGLKKASEYFHQAIEKDPAYALAYAGLADAYALLGVFEYLPSKDAYPKAKAAAEKALDIDDMLAEAHTSLAMVRSIYDWDWSTAEREFKRAIELNPNYATAHDWYAVFYLTAMERLDEAITEIKRAQELDPLSLIINSMVGWIFYLARQYDQAIEQYRKTLEMDPHFVFAHNALGSAYQQKGMYEEAIAAFLRAKTVSGDSLQAVALGEAYELSGWRGYCRKALDLANEKSKQSYISPYIIARRYADLGEKDQAFEWLQKAYEERISVLLWLKLEPGFDSLRSDPRFTALLKKVGLE
ncbi:MAG: protein kinase domain-containing protein [bacterium]